MNGTSEQSTTTRRSPSSSSNTRLRPGGEDRSISPLKVTNVTPVNRQGKRKRNRRTGGYGTRPDSKRAIVSLAEGDTIEIFGS